jgi:hypothetical protein
MTQQLFLFGEAPVDGPANALPKPPKAERWVLADHACRHCFGRLLRTGKGKTAAVQCSQCGRREEGPVDALCACGVTTPGGRHLLECYRNTEKTLEVPHEILVRVRELEEPATEAPSARRVAIPGF